MNRMDESESTPKKRNPKQQQHEAAVAKDAVTKSGRKVKRPAHLDSPERALSASPSSEPRKSVAARAQKATEPGYAAATPGKRATTKEQATSPEEERSSRKTIASIKKTNSGKLDTPKGKAAKDSIVDDGVGVSKSGRKIKIPAKLAEFDSDVLSSPSRKNVVPEHDGPIEDKPAKTSTRTKTPAKSALKNIAVNDDDDDEEDNKKAARKTPGRRAKSVTPSDQPEEEETVSTPRRRGVTSLFAKEVAPAELSHPKTPGKRMEKSDVLSKTPGRRAKSMAPATNETESKTPKKAIPTPGRRAGKSIANPSETSNSSNSDSLAPEQQAAPKTPGRRAGKSMLVPAASVATLAVESPTAQRAVAKTPGRRRTLKSIADEDDTAEQTSDAVPAEELMSRSGRKIKPKKAFDFEQDEKIAEQLVDGSRKRKAEKTKESPAETAMSPMKRKVTASVDDAQQTPKLKSRLASQSDNNVSADASVSRSGRKIKPKKMFGFEDGESSATVVHITGSSPSVDEESAAGKSARNIAATKAKVVSTPLKAQATSSAEPRPDVIDQEMDSKPQTFTTKRGIDNHRPSKHQHSRDETDCAVVSSEPMIIRTSIGFGKPKVIKPSPSKQRAEGDDDCSMDTANVTSPPCDDAQLVGNTRSGRKIKPKKFFDIDTKPATATLGTPSVVSVKEMQTVVLSSPKEKDANEQEPEKTLATNSLSADNTAADEMMATVDEGVDIPEGPVKILSTENEPTEGAEEQKPQTEFITAKSDSNDMEMELDKELPAVEKDEEKGTVVLNDETMANEESADAQLVDEKSEKVQEKQQTDREKEGGSDDKNLLSNVALPGVVNADGSDSVAQPVAANETTVPEALVESCSEKDTEVAHHGEADQKDGCNPSVESKAVNESVQPEAPIDENTLHDKDLSVKVAVDVSKPEIVAEDINATTEIQNDAEMLEETSFGDIEYLEDEKSNIVEHIQKPSALEEVSGSSAPPEAVAGRITLSPTAVPSIVIVPETPAHPPPNVLNDTFSPVAPSRACSSSGVAVIDITADTPRQVVAATAPRTPDSMLLAKQESTDKCSPDKPPEVIEIMDSPAVAAFCKQIDDESARGTDGGSATSTPLAVRFALLQHKQQYVDVDEQQQQQQNEGRKRSLSTSAADTTMKRNVTFHSPANCTMLVETIDERLMLKSLQDQQQQQQDTMESSSCSSKGIGEKLRKPRKRSLSEHKPSELKRTNKVSKLPNFKSIHANHFNRMESLADFMKRKESRAKQILSSCSPATKLLSNSSHHVTTHVAENPSGAIASTVKKAPPSTTKPFVFKSAGGGGIPVPSSVVAGLFVKRTKEAPTAAKSAGGPSEHHQHQTLSATATATAASAAKKPIPSDTERMANRLKQFQTIFKPKQTGTTDTAGKTTTGTASTSQAAVGERPVEQLRSKQSKILKGVRTNRRFELQMKHRDNVQHQ